MQMRFHQTGLLRNNEHVTEIDITLAWRFLSRLDSPARYCGRAQDGSHEYAIIDLKTGDLIATGRGGSLEYSICDAALNATALLNP